MTERTVSVELTKSQLISLIDVTANPKLFPDCSLWKILWESQRQLQQDTDREAKLRVIRENTALPRGYDPEIVLRCINEAGWDLVRIDKEV